jgi:4'-phosphopantetheinyl transferase
VKRPGWLTALQSEVPAGAGWLSSGERDVLGGMRFLKRRSDWRLGRWAAKRAVASWLGCDLDRIEIVAAPDGAPEARLDGAPAPAAISLSHRAGHALALVGEPGTALGCDLELIEPRSEGFVETWLAPAEQTLVAAAAPPERPALANLVWSAKEAAAKARREGLRVDVREAGVDFSPPGRDGWGPLHVSWPEAGAETGGWWRQDGDFILTVAVDGPEPPVRLA